MRRLILALGVVATIALSVPSDTQAAGLLRRLFRRPPVQRQLNIQVGGGRGIAINRQVIRQAPVVVRQRIVRQRVVRQGFGVHGR